MIVYNLADSLGVCEPPACIPSLTLPALADLVAHPTRPTPLSIGPDNRPAGPATIGQDTAYAIRLAADVVVLDLDTTDAPQLADTLAERFTAAGLPVLRVASGRPGHRHVWTVAPTPHARRVAEQIIGRLDLGPAADRSRQAMRPPGSPHREGLPVELLDGPDKFIAAVTATRAAAAADRSPFRWRIVAATGEWPTGWGLDPTKDNSRSALTFCMAEGAIREGVGFDEFRAVLASPANKGGERYREDIRTRDRRSADRWLEDHIWQKAIERVAAGPYYVVPTDDEGARQFLDEATQAKEAAIEAGEFSARPPDKGPTKSHRKVLEHMIAKGRVEGTVTPTYSIRDLARDTGVSENTVLEAIKRLTAAEWVQVVEAGRGHTVLTDDGFVEKADAATYRITIPQEFRGNRDTGGTPPAPPGLGVAVSTTARDACVHGGLGGDTERLVALLREGRMTLEELTRRLGRKCPRSLRRGPLKRLEAFEIVDVDADGLWGLAVDDVGLDAALVDAAETLGTAGKTEAKRARHARERAGYLDWRERTRPRRLERKRANIARHYRHRRRRPHRGQQQLEIDLRSAPVPGDERPRWVTGADAPPNASQGLTGALAARPG